MKFVMMNLKCRKLVSFAIHAVRVTFADAVLYAVAAALYGIVFGGFGAQARNELTVSSVFSIGGTCAMIGFVIGAAVAVFTEVARVRSLRQRRTERTAQTTTTLSSRRRSRSPSTVLTRVMNHSLIVVSGKPQSGITSLSH